MTDQKVYQFTPDSVLQGLTWSLMMEGYSLKQAWRRLPVEVPAAAIKSCSRIKTGRGTPFLIEFEGKYLNQLPCSRLPEGWDQPVGAEKTQWEVLKPAALDYARNFYKRSVLTTFALVLWLAVYLLLPLQRLVTAQVAARGWFVNGNCGVECARAAVSVHFGVLLVLLCAALPLVWSLWFLRHNLPGVRSFHFRRVMQIEGLMLSCMSLILTFQVLARLQQGKYLEFAVKHWNGTLGSGKRG